VNGGATISHFLRQVVIVEHKFATRTSTIPDSNKSYVVLKFTNIAWTNVWIVETHLERPDILAASRLITLTKGTDIVRRPIEEPFRNLSMTTELLGTG
jgi:hypothetical protein